MADILRRHGPAYLEKYGQRVVVAQRRVLADLTACRTRAMGSYADRCNYCGSSFFGGFNSCRNRHCPTCGGPTRARWLDQARQLVLPIPHFHLIFTLPDSLSRLILANRRALYNLLFRSAWETIEQVAADPNYLGGQTGAILVLHTWNQHLGHHPHIHAVVPAGVLSPDGHWRDCDPDFFIPVEVLSDRFRRKFLDALERLYDQSKLQLRGKLSPLGNPHEFDRRLIKPLREKAWVVHAQRAPILCRRPEALLKYLARYVAGMAISDQRLISYNGRQVIFSVKDRERNEYVPAKLGAMDFTCRFLMHVLPKGFQRVRYRGLFHGTKRSRLLPKIRQQLAAQPVAADTASEQDHEAGQSPTTPDTSAQSPTCPACGLGQLKKITSRDSPENWLQVLSSSTFQPPFSQWDELDLADWTPVLPDDPPAPLRCLSQRYLPFVDDEFPADDARAIERCRGQPLTQSSPKAA